MQGLPIEVKVCIIGDTDVGKTSLSMRYCHGEFPENATPTIGASFLQKRISIEGMEVSLQVGIMSQPIQLFYLHNIFKIDFRYGILLVKNVFVVWRRCITGDFLKELYCNIMSTKLILLFSL